MSKSTVNAGPDGTPAASEEQDLGAAGSQLSTAPADSLAQTAANGGLIFLGAPAITSASHFVFFTNVELIEKN